MRVALIRPFGDRSETSEVGGILDYAAEAKDGELPETVKPIDEEDGGQGLLMEMSPWDPFFKLRQAHQSEMGP